jgi:hypothetical protein
VRHPRFSFTFFAAAVLFGGTIYLFRAGPLNACHSRERQLAATIAASAACGSDADCALLVRTCGAFATCGEGVRAGALGGLERDADAFNQSCGALGGLTCVSCVPLNVRCQDNRCMTEPARRP